MGLFRPIPYFPRSHKERLLLRAGSDIQENEPGEWTDSISAPKKKEKEKQHLQGTDQCLG